MVIKDWYGKYGETIFKKYNRFLTEIVEEGIDCYVHNNQMITDVEALLGSEEMYIELVEHEKNLPLDMLMYRNGVTSQKLYSCNSELFIITSKSAELMVNYILTFNQLGCTETECLAFAMHRLVNI